jgi:hypothetical protein
MIDIDQAAEYLRSVMATRSVYWFTREFLAHPPPHITVDWSTASLCGRAYNGSYWQIATHHSSCLAGARVIVDHPQRAIWVLTGEGDDNGDLEGRWPD